MTNNQIKQAFFDILNDASLGYPIAWPGINFDPPTSGVWLQVSFFPNEPIDNGLAYDSSTVKRGIFQVECFTRKGLGDFALGAAADQIKTTFSKGTTISGKARIIREPFDMPLDYTDDKISTVVSVEYSE